VTYPTRSDPAAEMYQALLQGTITRLPACSIPMPSRYSPSDLWKIRIAPLRLRTSTIRTAVFSGGVVDSPLAGVVQVIIASHSPQFVWKCLISRNVSVESRSVLEAPYLCLAFLHEFFIRRACSLNLCDHGPTSSVLLGSEDR
jgi:hypothetical protein